MIADTFDWKCPYCGSEDISHDGHVNDCSIAYNAEEYHCNGKCQKTFYVQNHDECMIMKATMQSNYLGNDSLALLDKRNLQKIAIEQEVTPDLPVCGNCVSYEWGKDYKGRYDRHIGSCSFQHEKFNYTISDAMTVGRLHALTNAEDCDCFFNCNKNRENLHG